MSTLTAEPIASQSKSAPSTGPVDDKALVAHLQTHVDPVRTSLFYKLGLLIVAITMLVLPLIYVALIAAAGYCEYWYATQAGTIFTGVRNARAALLAYLAPLGVGAVLLVFMVKPLFSRSRQQRDPVSLKLLEEPLLHSFIYKLCDLLRAPRPCRIDVNCQVNASASFRGGLIGFLRRDLVLTIGLPLAGGMNLRQLTGVLSHELGHFAQGGGMRLTYIIRSISFWFARVVYQRDGFDDMLISASHQNQWGVVITAWLARLFVWLTRRVLWVLMFIGHAVSAMMLRQMEFDADRYETRVAGTDTFLQNVERLAALSVASQAAFADVSTAWRERRLCDDFPLLIRNREAELSDELRIEINKAASSNKTGWFDSHPSTADRKASARRENARGVFRSELPATVLFKDFDAVSRRATLALYREQLGRQFNAQNIVPTESLIQRRGQQKQLHESLGRFFQGLIDPRRPAFPGPAPAASALAKVSEHVCAERLLEARSNFLAALPAAQACAKRFSEADANASMASAVKAVRMAGVKNVKCRDQRYTKIDDESTLRAMERQADAERSEAAAGADGVILHALARLQMALLIDMLREAKTRQAAAPNDDQDTSDEYALSDEHDDGATDGESPTRRLLDALSAMKGVAPSIELLRAETFVLGGLLAHCQPRENPKTLIGAVVAKSRAVSEQIRAVHRLLSNVKYPYDHAERNVTLARFVAAQLPPPEQVGQVHAAADAAVDGFYALYMRMMADLSSRAEAVESSLGLQQLEAPADSPSESPSNAATTD